MNTVNMKQGGGNDMKPDEEPTSTKDVINKGRKDHALPENSHENLNDRLDEAVDDTFPASDPVSVKITK